ncbi:MAG: hypothetical protein ACFNUL_02715 [Cardiobacterium hominis]
MNHDYIFDGAPETRRGRETRQNAIIALQWLMEEEDNPTVRAACEVARTLIEQSLQEQAA